VVVLASNNVGKLQEIEQLLTGTGIKIKPQVLFNVPEIEETGLSFVENAILKARHAAEITGLACIADDSGLVVDALSGAPGIYSSRYAGNDASDETNLSKLINDLDKVPDDKRQAHFYCVVVYMAHALDPMPIICQGSWHGAILREPRGDHGFGYDPIFYLPDRRCSVAELSAEVKNKLSHRGQALQELVAKLQKA